MVVFEDLDAINLCTELRAGLNYRNYMQICDDCSACGYQAACKRSRTNPVTENTLAVLSVG